VARQFYTNLADRLAPGSPCSTVGGKKQPRIESVGVTMISMWTSGLGRLFMVLLVVLPGCSGEPARSEHEPVTPPMFVFVPADDYHISVQITIPQEAVVGEWVPLKAERRSGPWKRVKLSEVLPETPWFAQPPPEHELEVASNLSWITEPPGAARFDVPTPAAPMTGERRAMFAQPGVYRVLGLSKYPTEAESNVVTVTVRANR